MPETVAPLPDATFRCEVECHRDAAHVIAIGELDIATVPIVDERLAGLRDAGFRRLVLELRQVTFMSAGGLGLVLAWSAEVNADGLIAFQVIPGPAAVQRLFAMTGTAGQVDFIEGQGVGHDDNGGGQLVAFLDRAVGAGTPLSERLITLWGTALGRRSRHRPA